MNGQPLKPLVVRLLMLTVVMFASALPWCRSTT